MLKIEHLTKTYGEKKAVDDLSLHIHAGEIYGFIGHNGAGKTTTLKSVAGILRFDGGEILVDGKSVRTQPLECKKMIAYIPDNPDLYEYMTSIKYLNFIADISSSRGTSRLSAIMTALSLTSLPTFFSISGLSCRANAERLISPSTRAPSRKGFFLMTSSPAFGIVSISVCNI